MKMHKKMYKYLRVLAALSAGTLAIFNANVGHTQSSRLRRVVNLILPRAFSSSRSRKNTARSLSSSPSPAAAVH
jgi:hypothetical protein